MTLPVWERAGMSRAAYAALPWREMSKILRRYVGIWIDDSCSGCGRKWSAVREAQSVENLPENLRKHPFGRLIYAHVREEAEKRGIKERFPHAQF